MLLLMLFIILTVIIIGGNHGESLVTYFTEEGIALQSKYGDIFYRRQDSLAIKGFIHVLIHSCVFRSIYVGRPYFQVSFNESQAYLGHFSLKLNIHQRIVSSPRNELFPVLCSGSSSLFLWFNLLCDPRQDTPFCQTHFFTPHGSQTFAQPFWALLISVGCSEPAGEE